ncbi:MAG: hypothetical protein IMZ66_03925 [Planctomycetes bacterium]|nr:hypothetical protein [Planctomycetota bacterium]
MVWAGRGMAAAAALALVCLAGCGHPHATVQYTSGGAGQDVTYDSTTFQLAKDYRVQVLLFRRTAAAIGTADSDMEYVFFELPERDDYGWLKGDRLPVYRWVREAGSDHVWLGASGQAAMAMGDSKQHMHFTFRVTMEPVGDTPGDAYVFSGTFKVVEDAFRTQSLINRYGPWLGSLVNPKPEAPAAAK